MGKVLKKFFLNELLNDENYAAFFPYHQAIFSLY